MDEYLGFKEVVLSDDEINSIFQNDTANTFNCLPNQYLIAKDGCDNILELMRCTGDKMVKVPYKTINSRFLGKVKPRNTQQQLAIDMLYNSDITVKVIAGKFGTGKDFLMCSAAIDLLEHNKFEKIVYVRNNIEVKNSKPIGYLPGSYNEKLLPFAMPLADHLGGTDGLSLMVGHGQIEIVHLGFIRGRDIKNSIILCSEAENMTKEHIQLLLGRVGEGSALWINGDFKQCDAEVFRQNSGLMAAVDKLKGHPRFGYVKLLKTERSETAAMADLLD
jgi:predicted ribonuclease YlaK